MLPHVKFLGVNGDKQPILREEGVNSMGVEN